MRTISSLFVLATFSAVSVSAAETTLVFEPSHTTIHWTLDSVLHTVHGTFQLRAGTIRFDPATGKASGQLTVAAASGESGNESRDSKMHKSILESARFPDIVFTPERVEGAVPAQGAGTVQVHGAFQLHGATHAFTLPVEVVVEPAQITAKSKFDIPYLSWGLKNPSTFVLRVGDKVTIDLNATGRISGNGVAK